MRLRHRIPAIEQIYRAYFGCVLPSAQMALEIVEVILEGRQPPEATLPVTAFRRRRQLAARDRHRPRPEVLEGRDPDLHGRHRHCMTLPLSHASHPSRPGLLLEPRRATALVV